MRRTLGLLFILGAVVCAALAYFLKPHASLQVATESSWIAYPIGILACLILGSFCLFTARRAFGVIFLCAAAVCLLFAYMNGGPAWGSDFELSRSIRQGGHWAALGGAVCAFIGLMMALGRRKPAIIPGTPVEPPAEARARAMPPRART